MVRKKRRFTTPVTKRKLVVNRGTRIGGADAITHIAIHTTESHPRPGVSDLLGLWSWFNNPISQASSAVGIQDVDVWRFVPDTEKAWTIGVANSFTLNIEVIGFAAFSPKQWLTGSNYQSLKSTAKVIAYWSRKWNIPIQKGTVLNAAGVCLPGRHGVIRHSDVTKAGFGTHTDPGKGFPLRLVLRWARWYAEHGWL